MKKINALQQSFNQEKLKSEKYVKTVQVLQEYLKIAKAARTAADNSTFLHSDIFQINTDKLQVNELLLVDQPIENFLIWSLTKNIPNR